MVTVYGIPNCNTVKKALDWLKANGQQFEFHDFKKKGVTEALLQQWFDAFGFEKVVNKAGLTFKKLSKEERANINTPATVMAYLLQNTSAIKRPVVEKNGKPVLLGFKEEEYQAQF